LFISRDLPYNILCLRPAMPLLLFSNGYEIQLYTVSYISPYSTGIRDFPETLLIATTGIIPESRLNFINLSWGRYFGKLVDI